MGARTVADDGPQSLYAEARREAERHKWIESQKQGRDLGDHAIRDWYRNYWLGYCRCKRLEHVSGRRRWHEFEELAFGQLHSLIVCGDLLVDRILDRIDAGFENLELIQWAHDWGLSVPRVVSILEQVDVNRARLEPHHG
ncbi:MAG: hypothetical protein ACE5KM_10300 [Planctomycetaceae bacterium]